MAGRHAAVRELTRGLGDLVLRLPDPSLVVLVGPAGAGKTTLASRHFGADEVLSSDSFRELVSGDAADQRATRPAFGLLHRRLAERVAARQLTVVDATNVERHARRALVSRAAAAGVPAVAVVLDLPLGLVLARNAARPGRIVPADVVESHWRLLRQALVDRSFATEGFRLVAVLDRAALDALRIERLARAAEVFLETDRLLLRRFTPADVDLLVELDSDPEVMRYITGGRATSREEIESEVLPAFLAYYRRFAGFGFWAAIEKASGTFLGWFHFRPRDGHDPDEVELGYRLRRSAWGKGYATEASRALVEKGFAELGVRRVTAEAMAVNGASRRVMEKAGLRYVRTFHQPWPDRIEGDEQGDVEYALTREEWGAAR